MRSMIALSSTSAISLCSGVGEREACSVHCSSSGHPLCVLVSCSALAIAAAAAASMRRICRQIDVPVREQHAAICPAFTRSLGGACSRRSS